MLANAQGLFNRASSVLATTAAKAADRLDSLGQQIKDELKATSGDKTAAFLETTLAELDDYKRLVSNLEMQLVELSKQSRLSLASREAEMNLYKNKLQDLSMISQDNNEELDSNRLSVEIEIVKAEKIVLEETLMSLQIELQSLRDSERVQEMKDAKLVRLEGRYREAVEEFHGHVKKMESNQKAKADTVEELVREYSRLAAEIEGERNYFTKQKVDLQRMNETLTIKVAALEEAVSAFADKSMKNASDQEVNLDGMKALRLALAKLDQLACELAMIEEDDDSKIFEDVHSKEDPSILRDIMYEQKLGKSSHTARNVFLRKMEYSLRDIKAFLTVVIMDKEMKENMTTRTKQLFEKKSGTNIMGEDELLESYIKNRSIAVLRREKDEARSEHRAVEDSLRLVKSKEKISISLISSMKQQIEDMKREIECRNAINLKNAMDLQSKFHSYRLNVCQNEAESLESQLLVTKATDRSDEFLTSDTTLDKQSLDLNESLCKTIEDGSKYKIGVECLQNSTKKKHESTNERMRLKNASDFFESGSKINHGTEKKLEVIISDAVNKAVKENTEELAKNADSKMKNLRGESSAEFARREIEYVHKASTSTRSALYELKAKFDVEKSAALMEMAKASEKRLGCALEFLNTLKDEETHLAAHRAEKESLDKLDSALKAQVEKGKAEIEAMRLSQQSLMYEAEKARDMAKMDLLNVEERFLQREKDALARRELEVREEMQVLMEAANKETNEYKLLYTKENRLRKTIHNKLLELQGNIRVFCRVRPIMEIERKRGEDVDITAFPTAEDLIIQRDVVTKTQYEYDRVFKPSATQEEVFSQVQPVCISVLDGYNICIFAYGQTGSGKTYTMEGSSEISCHSGVSPRAVSEIFRLIDEVQDTWEYTVHFSMLEIYNETIRDLLVLPDKMRKDEKALEVRQTFEGNHVPGLTEESVCSSEQVFELMKKANRNRAVGSHEMNRHSSRSHCILTLVCKGRSKCTSSTTYGKMNLIDLAGSERVSKTDAIGERLKEAQNINRSLSALGDVINALGDKKSTHVPYRNSKLTFLLQDSLGGNSKCLMFVNISPAIYNLSETICSLNFASRCRHVELGATTKQTNQGTCMNSSSSNGGKRAKSGNVGTFKKL